MYGEPELVVKSHLLGDSACRDVHNSRVRLIVSVLRQIPAEFAVLNSLSTKMAGFFQSAGKHKKLFFFTVSTSSCGMVAADAVLICAVHSAACSDHAPLALLYALVATTSNALHAVSAPQSYILANAGACITSRPLWVLNMKPDPAKHLLVVTCAANAFMCASDLEHSCLHLTSWLLLVITMVTWLNCISLHVKMSTSKSSTSLIDGMFLTAICYDSGDLVLHSAWQHCVVDYMWHVRAPLSIYHTATCCWLRLQMS